MPYIACGTDDGKLYILDAKTKTEKILATLENDSILAVAWDKSSTRAAFGTGKGRLAVYTRKGKECYIVSDDPV